MANGAIVHVRQGMKNYRCSECGELIRSDLGENHVEQVLPGNTERVGVQHGGGFLLATKAQRVRYHIVCPSPA